MAVSNGAERIIFKDFENGVICATCKAMVTGADVRHVEQLQTRVDARVGLMVAQHAWSNAYIKQGLGSN